MKKEIFNIAVYIDMENVASTDFILEDVMNYILSFEDDYNCIFAIKSAYGNQKNQKESLRKQALDHNFYIIDTPKIGKEKNRADLLISLDAFETLYLSNPKIDRYCFMTSDVDFTVIADKLRKFGRDVWLVCKKDNKERAIIAKSFDKLLFLEDFSKEKTRRYTNEVEKLFVEALEQIDHDSLPKNVSIISDKMKTLDSSFRIKNTDYKTFKVLINEMANKKYIEFEIKDSGESQLLKINSVE